MVRQTLRGPRGFAVLLALLLPSLLGTSAARAAQELVLGQSAPFSGASAQLGRDYRDGAMAWFSEVNRRGGIHGRTVRLVSLDDRYEPQLTLRNTKQLLGRDHAFALFGYVGTPTVKVILPLVDQQQVPLVAPLTGARLLEALEVGVRVGGLGSGPYPQVSGLRFAIDARRPSGSRVVGALRREDGSVIAPTETLRVTTVTYPACRSGDGYRFPEAMAACAALERDATSAPRTVDLVIRHVEAMRGRIVAPPLGRVTRLDGSTPVAAALHERPAALCTSTLG